MKVCKCFFFLFSFIYFLGWGLYICIRSGAVSSSLFGGSSLLTFNGVETEVIVVGATFRDNVGSSLLTVSGKDENEGGGGDDGGGGGDVTVRVEGLEAVNNSAVSLFGYSFLVSLDNFVTINVSSVSFVANNASAITVVNTCSSPSTSFCLSDSRFLSNEGFQMVSAQVCSTLQNTISDSVFAGNHLVYPSEVEGLAGVLLVATSAYVSPLQVILVQNCSLTSNTISGFSGGAAVVTGPYLNVLIESVIIVGNVNTFAGAEGSGIAVYEDINVVVSNTSTICDNLPYDYQLGIAIPTSSLTYSRDPNVGLHILQSERHACVPVCGGYLNYVVAGECKNINATRGTTTGGGGGSHGGARPIASPLVINVVFGFLLSLLAVLFLAPLAVHGWTHRRLSTKRSSESAPLLS